ncbi:MAG: DUF2281 domain-containing protein [Chloroflexi bacterium]|nr:DUF2281 domain-containing protein [Chloroflexota bacterium]MBI4505393.1 DUF2281 domain-containing protein [Chloroflexota bacterium]
MARLEGLLKRLPPELHPEVADFVAVLFERRAGKAQRKLHQSWAGALREYRDRYTSLELKR